jgi:copper resistance protein C
LSADPAPGSTTVAPKSIELHFSEAIARKFSHFSLTGPNGAPLSLSAIAVKDTRTLAASPAAALTPGNYTIAWVAVATDDGHKTSGNYRFAVK